MGLLSVFAKKQMIPVQRELDCIAPRFPRLGSSLICREFSLDIRVKAADYVPTYGRVRRPWKTYARPGILRWFHPIIPSWNVQAPRDGSPARALPVLYPEASTFLATHPSRPSPLQLVWPTAFKMWNNTRLRHDSPHLQWVEYYPSPPEKFMCVYLDLQNMALCGKGVFADVMSEGSWDKILMDSGGGALNPVTGVLTNKRREIWAWRHPEETEIQEQRPCDERGRDTRMASNRSKNQGRTVPQRLQKEDGPAYTSISDFELSELWENTLFAFLSKFMVISYNGPRELLLINYCLFYKELKRSFNGFRIHWRIRDSKSGTELKIL